MKVNGYQIREAIKHWTLLRDTLICNFNESLHVFEGETISSSPIELMSKFDNADQNIAKLECCQQKFNQIVLVKIQDKSMTLSLAVKLVGGAGRREKLWRDAATPKKDRFSYRDEMTRSKDTEYARPVLTKDVILQNSESSMRYASALRAAIAQGNSQEVNIESLDLTSSDYKTLFQ